MRIIAGEFRGRQIKAPGDRRTRPTADRVREAWFSILGDRVVNASVLDLFAGSGALGLEALSRGAERVEFVEAANVALRTLRSNIADLDVEDRVKVHRADAIRFAKGLDASAFDIAVADPPYKGDHGRNLVGVFKRVPFASVFAVEHRAADDLTGDETRRYGDAALTFCYAP